MLIKTVTTVVTTDSTGKPIDALPVRAASAGETDSVGRPVTPVPVIEDANGVPVRVVTGKMAQNSAGQWIDSIAVSGSVGPTLPAFTFEAETLALNAAQTSQPTARRKYHQNRLISRLKAGGVWAKVLAFYAVGADEQSSLINWKAPGTYNLTKVGAPTFTANDGWQATGTGQYLRTGMALNALSQNNHAHYCYSKTSAQSGNSEYGAVDGSSIGISLVARSTTDSMIGRCASATGEIGAAGHTNGLGMHGAARSSSSGYTGHRNGVAKSTLATASTAFGSQEIFLLTVNVNGTPNTNYSARKQSAWYFGQALSETEARLLYAATADYLEAIQYGEPEIYDAGYGAATVNADFIAYGLTGQSIAAAYEAARAGRTVAICGGWRDRHFGGMSGGGLGYTDFDSHAGLGGLPRWIITQMNAIAGRADTTFYFEPKWFRYVMRQLLDPTKNGGFNIPVYFSNGVDTVSKSGKQISKITTKDGRSFVAKQYFDGSYEGDLVLRSSVSYTLGREAAGTSAESYNGVRGVTTSAGGNNHQFKAAGGASVVYVDPWQTPGDTTSGLVAGVQAIYSTFTPALHNAPTPGTADNRLQAYNFRLTMTNDATRRVPLPTTPPPGYTKARYELLLRYLNNNPTVALSEIFKQDLVSSNCYDVNAKWGFSSDLFGENWNYATGSYAQREAIWKDHWNFILGLWYLLQYEADSRIPSAIRTSALTWGWVQDHYLDNHPNDAIFEMPQLYVREGIRMVGDAVMNGNDIQTTDGTTPRISTNTVSTISYTMDSHSVWRMAYEYAAGSWGTWNEGNFENFLGGDKIVPVPIEICVPKFAECTNLSVGFAVSATHVAFGSIRMEYTAIQIGQTMGRAAALAAAGDNVIHNVNYSTLRTAMLASPALSGEVAPVLPQVN